MTHPTLFAPTLCAAALVFLLAGPVPAGDAVENPLIDSPTWAELRGDVVGDVPISDGTGIIDVEAPYRAHDAATVPVILHQVDPDLPIQKATVVIDENPAPVAAVMTFAKAMAPLDFELRVRVNQYSNLRVLAETDQGLSMNGRFVKASGGCSAPATRDPELALDGMGQMKLRMFQEPAMSVPRREAQIMIRHPNYSGLQRDQVTQLFIPAHFIDHMEVWQGDDFLFSVDGGISISENPVFRFAYDDNGAEVLTVKATDTEGNSFTQELSKAMQG
ncbi:quinoprotein dehydrogenase-associated SoxYZ-like carrier [Pseudooceanicola sp. HF7]|uniref:quinoprotein dehydrogenase-associated SoxYZ-like carrier n=1 Tax=Pseudooceanicola sp. HF7 TaxID=2721560 RepID=UPI00142F7B10|nr:quinoprotein dehydrogenase-associated SoxYZ-like carrier [Pseudooceanicola sp. HF7]NIZ09418.1 quinoprotein dehydrogenase-associated SoxYZ-like carrier [Pseudooceanicola sp. HF7]